MKIISFCIALTMWSLAMTHGYSQEIDIKKTKIELLKEKKDDIIAAERRALKQEVEIIHERLEKEELTYEEGEALKKTAAEKHALNIENKIAIIENQILLIERNGTLNLNDKNGKIFIGLGDADEDGDFIVGVKVNDGKQSYRKFDRRTYLEIVFAFGLNNTIIEGQSLNDSPYEIGGSRFSEFGVNWSTRVFENSNWLRFRYGLSLQYNGLKPTDNKYFVDTGVETELQEHPINLDKSKFRLDNLVVPVYFEMGPSRKIEKEEYFRYKTNRSFKIGIGGYAGIKLSTRQKLKYSENGEDVKQKLRSNYNTNNFIYGIGGYIGYGDTSLYLKYDLNTIFKDNPVKQRNVSLGLRFDMN
jgi:hypothetical protein